MLTAFEHQAIDVQPVGTSRALDVREAEALEGLGEQLGRFCERRLRSLRLSNYCGLVNLGPRLLEILPKIDDGRPANECRGLLLQLLRRSQATTTFQYLSADQTLRDAPLIDAFIAAFFDSVRDVLRGGLMRQYKELREDLRVVRGRIVANRQFSMFANRQDVVACDFDELTADNPWNQFIKAGLRTVRPWITSFDLRRRWADLTIAFDEVSDVELGAGAFGRLTVDRKARRCLHAAEWSRRILALQSPALRAGKGAAPGLLFDINRLWESAVAAELRRRFSDTNLQLRTQVTDKYLATISGTGRFAVPVRPDIVISRSDRALAIADTKWKRLEAARNGTLIPSSEDVYQMEAYAAAFECDTLVLIYPWHQGLELSRETVLELPRRGGNRPRLSLVCIDAFADFVPVRGRDALRILE